MATLLILQSNPLESPALRLANEVRVIKERLRLFNSDIVVKQHGAIKTSDLQPILLGDPAELIHFSGHGTEGSQLVLEDDFGGGQVVGIRPLKDTFRALRGNIRCVVLNSCYAKRQAKAIAESIDCVIGTPGRISDGAATAFAGSFYQAIGFGKSVKEAFALGCLEVQLHGFDQRVPQLHERTKGVASRTRFTESKPKIVAGFLNDTPEKDGNEYLMTVKIENLPAGVSRVVYEYIDDYEDTLDDYDDKFDIADAGRQNFESPCQFYGDVQIRAMVWHGNSGFGLTSWLSTALKEFYGRTRDDKIMRAIKKIANS